MARHGNSRHLNRLAASRFPRISRKTAKYLAKPRPGRHFLEGSVALLVVLRDKLGLASIKNEAKKIIKGGHVQINGKRVTDEKYPIGFGDAIKLLQSKETYEVAVGRYGDMKLQKVEGKEPSRLLKVVGKYLSKGNKLMVRLHDGSVINGTKEVKINDSVTLGERKIKSVIRFEKGAKCLVIKGAHTSETGVIKDIKAGSAVNPSAVRIESSSGEFETPTENVMVVGA